MILVVNGDAGVSRALVRALNSRGYSSLAVPDGHTAHLVLDREPIEAIILDLDQPRTGGSKLLEMIRRDLRFRRLPVIMCAAQPSQEEQSNLERLGVRAIVARADDSELLLRQLAIVLPQSSPLT